MSIVITIFGILIIGPVLLELFFPVKCPKCNKKCNKSFYLSGYMDSLYYECPEHGDINCVEKKIQTNLKK